MPRLRHMLLNLGVVLTIAGALTLSGCAATDGQATADDVNNNAFTFASGTVFHPALTDATTLEFIDKASAFTLYSAGGTASGGNRFGSCILTVSSSTYAPGTGPQANDVITLNTCEFDSTHHTLKVSNGPITATSNPAIARLVDATASDVNDKTFLFTSGEVFHTALANVAVTLKFTNTANSFTLTSTANTNNTASGSSFLSSGSCILTVTSSAYRSGSGPQINDVITLSTCLFNSSTGALTVSNGTVSITSI
jgi:hypothetical protein